MALDAVRRASKKELLDAHPPIGGKAHLGALGARAGNRRRPAGARRARRAERGLRAALRLPLRRVRERPAAPRDRSSCSRRACSGRARQELDDGGRRARADRGRSLEHELDARPRALRLLVGLGQPALPLAARDRGDGVDRRVVLLHRARQPPGAAEGPATTRSAASAARRGRCTAAASTASRSSGSRPERLPEPLYWFKWEAYTTWLSGFALFIVVYYSHATVVPDRHVGRRPDGVGGDRALRRRDRARLVRLRRALPRVRARRGAARDPRLRVHLRLGVGARGTCSRRGPRTCRSAR